MHAEWEDIALLVRESGIECVGERIGSTRCQHYLLSYSVLGYADLTVVKDALSPGGTGSSSYPACAEEYG